MTTDSSLRFEVTDRVAVLTLNRPESLNALNGALVRGLMEGLRRVREDDEIRVAVITGAGRAFCSGVDLKERASNDAIAAGAREGGAGNAYRGIIDAPLGEAYHTFQLTKPMIAAVNGFCLAGGFELALTCDIRISVPTARFGLPEITRGFFPGAGGPQRLMRAIPQAIAMDMLLTGEPIDADTALRAGVISRIVEPDDLMPTALRLAAKLAGYGPLALRALKEVALASQDLTLEQSLRVGGTLRWIVGQTEDAREGPRAFAEKRDPEYKGR